MAAESLNPTRSKLLKELGFEEEVFEEVQAYYPKTGFPKPQKRMRIVYEVYDLSIEETYFWIHKYLSVDAQFPVIDKLEDASPSP